MFCQVNVDSTRRQTEPKTGRGKHQKLNLCNVLYYIKQTTIHRRAVGLNKRKAESVGHFKHNTESPQQMSCYLILYNTSIQPSGWFVDPGIKQHSCSTAIHVDLSSLELRLPVRDAPLKTRLQAILVETVNRNDQIITCRDSQQEGSDYLLLALSECLK